MSDVDASAVSWVTRYAEALGVNAPSAEAIETLLSLAGFAARASHRQAAPVACWLAARAGRTPAEALAIAETLG